MRNLNECQAEVFRRSEKRIKTRKQRRNHILMVCIPLVLGVTLFLAFLLPGMLSSGSTMTNDSDVAMKDIYGGPEQIGDRIEVSGAGVSLCYTDPNDILLITDHLHKCGVETPKRNNPTGDNSSESVAEDHSYSAAGDTNGSITQYTITITSVQDGITQYTFTGLLLENESTHKTYALTPAQAQILAELLKIPCP